MALREDSCRISAQEQNDTYTHALTHTHLKSLIVVLFVRIRSDDHDHSRRILEVVLEDPGKVAVPEGNNVRDLAGIVLIPLDRLKATSKIHQRHIDVGSLLQTQKVKSKMVE